MKTSRGGSISRMAMVVVVALLAWGVCLTALGAGTNYVWLSAPNSEPPYDTWDTAATNIQTAIDYASTNLASYDTVLVTNGNYAVTNTISVTNGVKVIGFGGAAGTVVYRTGTPNFRVFSLTHANAVVDGLTISNGVSATGGGINMTAGTVRNCTIRGNFSVGDVGRGAGLYLTGGLVTNCLVTANSSSSVAINAYGGGIWMDGGTVARSVVSNNTLNIGGGGRYHAAGINIRNGTVVDCIIVSNTVTTVGITDDGWHEGTYGGGGVVLRGGVLNRSTIFGNRSNHRAGGVSIVGGSMMNCLVYSNTTTSATASQSGGGVWMAGGALLNCTVVRNRSSQAGLSGGLVMSGGGVTNTIVYFNVDANDAIQNVLKTGGTMSYSCTTPMVAGTGNVIEDPLFVDLDGLDLRLQASSACNDGGINLAAVTTDWAGNPRPVDFYGGGEVHDIGAYERQDSPSEGDFRCRFTGTPRQGLVGFQTVLTASAAGANTEGLTYYWYFTNGPSADLWGADKRIVTNMYPAGIHSVRLVVSNNTPEGASSLHSGYIEVLRDQDAFVATNGANTYPYDSWETAARDVNVALARLKTTLGMGGSSNTVWVGNGSHGVNVTVLLNTNIVVRGASGTAADSVVYRNDTPEFRVFSLTHSNAVVEGLTITNGLSNYGGCIYMTAGTVRNCTIRENRMSGDPGYGGGIYLTGGLVTNCLVTANGRQGGGANSYGGGIWMSGGTVAGSVVSNNTLNTSARVAAAGINLRGGTVVDCIIVSNTVTTGMTDDGYHEGSRGGGGVVLWTGGVLNRSTIFGNRSNQRGGGVSFANGGSMMNCLLYGNTTTSATLGNGGGGIWMSGGAVVNCTVATNAATATEGGGVSQSGGGVTNTIVYFNSGTVSDTRNVYKTGGTMSYSCSTPLVSGGSDIENIADDPRFVDMAAGNFRLRADSLCVDAGTTNGLAWLNPGSVDLEGNPRLLGTMIDIGAYETVPPRGTMIMLR